ncbi:Serine/threonine-protein kinase 11-interacting protein, partial [Lamellibrachia satsuma]
MSSAMSWPELRVSNLSYNNIHELDDSLRLLPALELINVSHNNISRTDSHLLYLTELRVVNLGYNIIEVIPSFALSSRLLLHTLILRNNNISQLDGLQEMVGLRELDLANNCLCCHGDLAPLRPLKKLRELVVKGNPLSYQNKHRCLTFAFLHSTALKQ